MSSVQLRHFNRYAWPVLFWKPTQDQFSNRTLSTLFQRQSLCVSDVSIRWISLQLKHARPIADTGPQRGMATMLFEITGYKDWNDVWDLMLHHQRCALHLPGRAQIAGIAGTGNVGSIHAERLGHDACGVDWAFARTSSGPLRIVLAPLTPNILPQIPSGTSLQRRTKRHFL